MTVDEELVAVPRGNLKELVKAANAYRKGLVNAYSYAAQLREQNLASVAVPLQSIVEEALADGDTFEVEQAIIQLEAAE